MKIEIPKTKMQKMVKNHEGEQIILFTESDESSYNFTSIRVGYYCPEKDVIYDSMENWGFTQADIEDGVINPGIYAVDTYGTYGTSNCENEYICPLFAGYNTQAEEKMNWARALVYEAQTNWFEAEHPTH